MKMMLFFTQIMIRFRRIQYIKETSVKLVCIQGQEDLLTDFLRRNVKETPTWRVIKCDSVEFNKLRYTENDIKAFQYVEEKKYYKN